jgi:hypothetical protein
MNRLLYPRRYRFVRLLIEIGEREICTDRFFQFTNVSVCVARKQRRKDAASCGEETIVYKADYIVY